MQLAFDGPVGDGLVVLDAQAAVATIGLGSPLHGVTHAQIGGQSFLGGGSIVLLPCGGDGGELGSGEVQCVEDGGFALRDFGDGELLRRGYLRPADCAECGYNDKCGEVQFHCSS